MYIPHACVIVLLHFAFDSCMSSIVRFSACGSARGSPGSLNQLRNVLNAFTESDTGEKRRSRVSDLGCVASHHAEIGADVGREVGFVDNQQIGLETIVSIEGSDFF